MLRVRRILGLRAFFYFGFYFGLHFGIGVVAAGLSFLAAFFAALLQLFLAHARLLRGLFGLRKLFEQSRRRHLKCGKLLEACIERTVVNDLRIELPLDPSLQAHLADAFDVAGTRPETQTVEGVENRFVFAQVGGWQTFERRRLRLCLRRTRLTLFTISKDGWRNRSE